MRNFLFLFLFLSVSFLQSQSVVLGYSEQYPYAYLEEGQHKGVDIDTVRLILNSAGYSLEFKQLNPTECIKALEDNKIDGIITIMRGDYGYGIYSEEVLSYARYGFYGIHAVEIGKTSKVGLLCNFNYPKHINSFNNVMFFRDMPELITALTNQEIDLIFVDEIQTKWLSSQYGVSLVKVLEFYANIKLFQKQVKPNEQLVLFSNSTDVKLRKDFNTRFGLLKNTLIYSMVAKEYPEYSIFKKWANINLIYTVLVIVFAFNIFLFLFGFNTLKKDNLNSRSLTNITIGSIIEILSDVLPAGYEFTVPIKTLAVIIICYGSYQIIQKYHRSLLVFFTYIFVDVVCIGLTLLMNEISYSILILLFLPILLIILNTRKYTFNSVWMMNLACVLYSSYSLVKALAEWNFIMYNHFFAILFMVGFLLQFLTSKYEKLKEK